MLGDKGDIKQLTKVREQEKQDRERAGRESQELMDAILEKQVETLRGAQGKSAEKAERVSQEFEKYLESNELKGYRYRELFTIRLDEILSKRNELLEAGRKLSGTVPGKLGYNSEQWDELIKSYSAEYEDNPHFAGWSFLAKAKKLLTQRKTLTNLLKKFREE